MAITATVRYSNGGTSSETAFTFSPASDFTVGTFVVLFVAADNSATNGASNNITSVTDSLGNTWTKYQGPLYDPGSANQGIQGGVFTTSMDAGTITTSTAISVNFGDATTAKVVVLHEVTPTTGYRIVYSSSGNGTGTTNAMFSETTGSITANNIVLCACFMEGNYNLFAEDSDTTRGSWSSRTAIGVGTLASGVKLSTQYKVVTGTGTQTFDVSVTTSCDMVGSWIELSEVPASAGLIIGGKINNGLTFGRIIH